MKYWGFINEYEILEKLLKDNSLINVDTIVKVKLLVKHYKSQGLSKNEIRNEIDKFMMEHYNGFVLADWDDTLRRIVNKYSKKQYCELKKMDDIVIYKEELDFISSQWNIEGVSQIEVEKLLFAMLVLAKSNGEGVWLNYKKTLVFKLARYKYESHKPQQEQRGKLLYKLANHERKIIECLIYSRNGSIKLFYGVDEGEEVMRIGCNDDIENIIVRYLNWRQYPIYNYCKCCGKEIKRGNTKPSKYCKKCKEIIEREVKLKSYHKNKDK